MTEERRGKAWWDYERWVSPMPVPEGWTRVAVKPGQDEWDALPEGVSDEVDRPFFIEYQPSSIMGWGMAAVWFPNEKTEQVYTKQIFKDIWDRSVGVPWGGPTGLSSLSWLDVPVTIVRLRDLVLMQPEVSIAALMDPKKHQYSLDPFAHVVIFQTEYYLEDGHHRAMLAWIDGRTYLRARVLRMG